MQKPHDSTRATDTCQIQLAFGIAFNYVMAKAQDGAIAAMLRQQRVQDAPDWASQPLGDDDEDDDGGSKDTGPLIGISMSNAALGGLVMRIRHLATHFNHESPQDRADAARLLRAVGDDMQAFAAEGSLDGLEAFALKGNIETVNAAIAACDAGRITKCGLSMMQLGAARNIFVVVLLIVLSAVVLGSLLR